MHIAIFMDYGNKEDRPMYEMKPEYYIGIDMIDEEHKQLFKYADEAYELLHLSLIHISEPTRPY